MTKRFIRFFFVAASLMLYMTCPTGPVYAQADFSPADSDPGAEVCAPDDFAAGAGAQADRRDAESSWYAGTDMDQQSALAPCAMAVETGQPYADLESVDAATDSQSAPELTPWAGQAQQTWSNSSLPALSWEDREAIGRVAYAEAGNQGEEGIAAVIFTILNRVSSGQFQDSVQDVIDAPNQFEPATKAGGWRYLPPLDLTQSIQFETILNLILAGWLPDPTQGALFFQNTRIVAARAAAGVVSPNLVDFGGTPPVAEIGDHRFYDARAAANLSSSRWRTWAEDTDTVLATDGLAYGNESEDELFTADPGEPAPDGAPAPPDMSEGSGPQPAPAQDELQPG
jgi:spore germination cell wall hydrolase CwlJ-like protein